MFDQVKLIVVTSHKNENGEIIEVESGYIVPVVFQRIRRDIRDKYNERGLNKALRFRVNLFGADYNKQNIPYFEYNNTRFSVTDFVKDSTGFSYFIEGTTTKGGR